MSYNPIENIYNISNINVTGITPNSLLYVSSDNTLTGVLGSTNQVVLSGDSVTPPSTLTFSNAAVANTIAQRDNSGDLYINELHSSYIYSSNGSNTCQIITNPVDDSVVIRGTAINLIGPVSVTSTVTTTSTNNGFELNSGGTSLVDAYYSMLASDGLYSGLIFPDADKSSAILGRSATMPGSNFPVSSTLYMNLNAGSIRPGTTDYYNIGDSTLYYHNGYINDLYITTLNARPLPAPGTGKISLASVMDCNASERITNLLDPTAAQSAATKNYVDNAISGISIGSYLKLDCSNDPLTGALATQNVSPNLDLTYSIGDATHKFNSVYTTQVNSDGKDLELKTTGPSSVVSINPTSGTIKMNNSNLTMVNSIAANGTNKVIYNSSIDLNNLGIYNINTLSAGSLGYINMVSSSSLVNFNSSRLTGLLDGTTSSDAVTLSQLTSTVGAYLPTAGGTMTGAINMANCSLLKSSGTVNVGASGAPVDAVYTSSLSSPSVTTVGASISFNSKNLTSLGYLSAASQLNLNIGATTYQSLTSSASSIMVPQLAQLVINMNNSFLMQIDGIPNSTTTYITDRNILHWTNSGTWRLYYQERLSSYYNGPGTRQAYRTITEYGNTWEVDNFTANTRTTYYTMYPGTTGIYDLGTASLAWNTLYTRALDSDGTNPIVLYANFNPSGLGVYSMGIYGSNEFSTICSRAMSSSAGLLMSAANSISLNSPIIQLTYTPTAITYAGPTYYSNTELLLQLTNRPTGTNWLAFNSYVGSVVDYGLLIGYDYASTTGMLRNVKDRPIRLVTNNSYAAADFSYSGGSLFYSKLQVLNTTATAAPFTGVGCQLGIDTNNYAHLELRSSGITSYTDFSVNSSLGNYGTRMQLTDNGAGNQDFTISNTNGYILNSATTDLIYAAARNISVSAGTGSLSINVGSSTTNIQTSISNVIYVPTTATSISCTYLARTAQPYINGHSYTADPWGSAPLSTPSVSAGGLVSIVNLLPFATVGNGFAYVAGSGFKYTGTFTGLVRIRANVMFTGSGYFVGLAILINNIIVGMDRFAFIAGPIQAALTCDVAAQITNNSVIDIALNSSNAQTFSVYSVSLVVD